MLMLCPAFGVFWPELEVSLSVSSLAELRGETTLAVPRGGELGKGITLMPEVSLAEL